MAIDLSRRNFLVGLGAGAIAMPAVVHSGNIMPVRTPVIWRAPPPVVVKPLYRAWLVTGVQASLGAKVEMTPRLANAHIGSLIIGNCIDPKIIGARLTLQEVISTEPFGQTEWLGGDGVHGFDIRRHRHSTSIAGVDGENLGTFEHALPATATVEVDADTAVKFMGLGAEMTLVNIECLDGDQPCSIRTKS